MKAMKTILLTPMSFIGVKRTYMLYAPVRVTSETLTCASPLASVPRYIRGWVALEVVYSVPAPV